MSLDLIVRDSADQGVDSFDYAAKYFKIYFMLQRDVPEQPQSWYVDHARYRTRNYFKAYKDGLKEANI